jgi:antitoxin (DNA-binding transcriptional repressor) of toxin-antitoxin stability system
MFPAMSKTVNVAEFKDRFSERLALVERGGEVIVCRRNVPLARVEPIRKPVPRKSQRSVVGCMKGTVRIHGDLTEPCLPITAEVLAEAYSLPPPIHRDPADRILIATARHERLTLVTSDGKIRG